MLSLLDNLREVSVCSNMGYAINSYFIHGVQTIAVITSWLQDAIGCDNNGTGKTSKLKLLVIVSIQITMAKLSACVGLKMRARGSGKTYFLVLPGSAIVSDQMLVLFELWISMSWQHLSMLLCMV